LKACCGQKLLCVKVSVCKGYLGNASTSAMAGSDVGDGGIRRRSECETVHEG